MSDAIGSKQAKCVRTMADDASTSSDAGAVERKVAGIYAEVLGLDVVRPEDDLLSLNGDSHQAVLVALELEGAFGIEVPIERIGDLGAISNVAAWVREQVAAAKRSAG